MHAFSVRIEHLGRDPEIVPIHDFFFIGDMSFSHKYRISRRFPMRCIQADLIEKRVCRMVEHQDIIGNVHMAIVVDPVGVNRFAMQIQKVSLGHGGAPKSWEPRT